MDLFAPKSHNATLLVLDGRVRVNDSAPIEAPRAALFNHDGERVRVTAEADSVVLFLSGEPLEEPIAHYGPFVMNTPEEIHRAVADYNEGKFGNLTD